MRNTMKVLLASLLLGFSGLAAAETVLITGANSGIGLELAKQYAAKGWTVVATHRRDTTPDTLAALAKQYPKLRVEKMDVSSHEQVFGLAKKMQGEPIDVLINNAGIFRIGDWEDEKDTSQNFGTLNYEHFMPIMQ